MAASAPATDAAANRTEQSIERIRAYMKSRTCYEILPESFRLIVLNEELSIMRALTALQANGIVSAPVYDGVAARFVGMFTLTDVINVIQYYYRVRVSYSEVTKEVEGLHLGVLREIEEFIGVPPPPTVFVHPDQTLYAACVQLVRTHARRIPLIDSDEQTGKETILSVLTQYRVLKFIAINCAGDCARMTEAIGDLGVGVYVASYQQRSAPGSRIQPPTPSRTTRARSRSTVDRSSDSSNTPQSPGGSSISLDGPAPPPVNPAAVAVPEPDPLQAQINKWATPIAAVHLGTTVFDVVHIFSDLGISAVPVLDPLGRVINVYETVDIVDLIRTGTYNQLDLTIADALKLRPRDYSGIVTCSPDDSLAAIMRYIRERRVHRFVIVEPGDWDPRTVTAEELERAQAEPTAAKHLPGRLIGMLSLSDVLRILVGVQNSELRGADFPLGVVEESSADLNALAAEMSALGLTPASTVPVSVA